MRFSSYDGRKGGFELAKVNISLGLFGRLICGCGFTSSCYIGFFGTVAVSWLLNDPTHHCMYYSN